MTTLSQITEHVSAIRDEVICLCDRLDAIVAQTHRVQLCRLIAASSKPADPAARYPTGESRQSLAKRKAGEPR